MLNFTIKIEALYSSAVRQYQDVSNNWLIKISDLNNNIHVCFTCIYISDVFTMYLCYLLLSFDF